MLWLLRLAATVLAALWPSLAWAELVPISQDRSVTTHADLLTTEYVFGMSFPSNSTEDDATSAVGFENFDASATVTWATADQSSSIGPLQIVGSGSHDVAALAIFTGSPPADGSSTVTGSANSESAFRVDFELHETTPYTLDAHLEGWIVFGNLEYELELTGPGESVVFDINNHLYPDPATACSLPGMANVCGDASATGSLAPGAYVLTARTSGDAASFPANPSLWDGYTSGSWSFELNLAGGPHPVPALTPTSLAALVLGLAGFGAIATRFRTDTPPHLFAPRSSRSQTP